MKKFSSLSQQQKSEIINSRINSIFQIDKHILQTLLSNPETLSTEFREIPPSIPAQESIDKLIVQSSSELEIMYLTTYKQGGKVLFSGTTEYLINFVFPPLSFVLTERKNKIQFDGHNGLSWVKWIKVVSNDSSIMLMPSLTIVFKKDGQIIKQQSLSSFIKLSQTSDRIVDISLGVGEFQNLEISIVDNSEEHKYILDIGVF